MLHNRSIPVSFLTTTLQLRKEAVLAHLGVGVPVVKLELESKDRERVVVVQLSRGVEQSLAEFPRLASQWIRIVAASDGGGVGGKPSPSPSSQKAPTHLDFKASNTVRRDFDTFRFKNPSTGHFYRGVIDFLKGKFYSDYKYEEAVSETPARARSLAHYAKTRHDTSAMEKDRHTVTPDATCFRHLAPHPLRASRGLAAGRFIDQQLSALMKGNVDKILENTPACARRSERLRPLAREWIARGVCPAAIETLLTGDRLHALHAYVAHVLNYMAAQQYVAVSSQVAVACVTWKLATAIDMLWYHVPTGTLVLVELKKRDSDYHGKSNGMMSKPFEEFSNCIDNQDMLQILIGRVLFEHTFPEKAEPSALLLRVHQHGVEPTECNPKMYALLRGYMAGYDATEDEGKTRGKRKRKG